jgi:hypothetical protein
MTNAKRRRLAKAAGKPKQTFEHLLRDTERQLRNVGIQPAGKGR